MRIGKPLTGRRRFDVRRLLAPVIAPPPTPVGLPDPPPSAGGGGSTGHGKGKGKGKGKGRGLGHGIGGGLSNPRPPLIGNAAPDTTAPTITSSNSPSVAENATLSHALTADETVTWSIVGGADQALFEISGSTLRWASNGTQDYEAPVDADANNIYVVVVRATDGSGNTTDQTVTVTVTNVAEVTLAALTLSASSIAENSAAGTVVGAIQNKSSGSTLSIQSQSNANWFAISGGNLVIGSVSPDYETNASPTVTIRETHADGSNSPRDTVLTVTVTDVAEYGTVGPMALASRSSTTAFADGGVITYNNEVYDNEASFAPTSGTMTVPSGGLYRLGAGSSLSLTGYAAQKSQINGSLVNGGYGATCESTSPKWHSGWGAPLSLSASDVLRTINNFTAATYGADASNYTWLALERLPQSLKYARVRKSAAQTSFSSGNVTFDTEDADTDGWHDTVTNNDRLTVPSGVSRVRLLGNLVTGGFNGTIEAEIKKNGSADVIGLPSKRESGSGNKLANLFGPPINVTAGDYFTLSAILSTSNQINNEEFTWFAIEEVSSSIKSALVYNSAGQSVVSTADNALSWDSEDHDPDGMHSTVTNTSRLTVPSGCSWARLTYYLKGQLSSTAYMWTQVQKNGAGVIGTALGARPGASGAYQRISGASAWLAVSPGDYFELLARCNTGSLTTSGGWFAMECM